MERTTQIGIGVVVLALLGGAVYKVATDDAKKGTATTTSADLPEIKADGDVDKISITNGEKGEVVLEKKGDKWEVTKPLVAPANQSNVKSLVDNMKELKAKEVIVATPTDDQKKEFQFEPSKETHVVAWKGGAKKLDAEFGKSGARGQMAMVEGKPGIYAVSGYSSYLYQRELKGWRDTEIFKFDDANANHLEIDNKNGALSFTKEGDKWAGTFKGKPIDRFDEDKVKDALRAFKSLSAEDFGDNKAASETGLDTPESKVTIQLKDGAAKYVLDVGKTASGQSHYAKKEGDSTTYVIAQYSADWALADVGKFQKAADGGAPDGGKKEAAHPSMPSMGGMGGMGADPHGH